MMKRLPIAAAVTAAMLSTGAQAAYNDAGTDYTTARVDSHINDESFEPLQMVNMFLCIIKATGAETLWDQDYRALVNDDKCEQETGMSGGDEAAEGDRSSSSATEYADVVVSSSRANDQSPQVVHARYTIDEEDFGTQNYLVRTEVSTAPTDTAPFGELRFTWKEASSPDTNRGDMAISAESGSTVIQMIDQFDEGGNGATQKMRVQIDDGGNSGSGVVQGWDWQNSQAITFRLAYDNQYLLKSDGANETCLARPGVAAPIEKVWGYSLFNQTTGALLDIQAGFGFEYVDEGSGATRHGFIGNWGMWTENDDSPTTITHERTGDSYNVITAPGKLIRQRKGVRPLVDGESFEKFTEVSPGQWQPTMVSWNASLERFDNQQGNDAGITEGEFLWSPGLRQDINYQGDHDANIATPQVVAFATQEVVQPSDPLLTNGAVTLTCYGQCPKANVSKTDALAWNLYDGNPQDPATDPGTDYTLDPADMTLKVGGQPVSLAFSRTDLGQGEQFWGASVGEFVLSGTTVTGWESLNAPNTVTYRWEYGLDSWNQLTMIQNAQTQAFFEFDKPMKFPYTDQNSGRVYMLEYQGARNLHGIPWTQNGDDWEPEINIPNETVLSYTNASDATTNYVVKQVGIEKRMASVDASNCASLTLPAEDGVTLPAFTDADVAAAQAAVKDSTFFDGLDVSGQAPRVIHGVVQE